MGNCSLKGIVEAEDLKYSIRVMTDSGDIVEFEGPKSVKEVLNDYPGHGIYQKSRMSSALNDHELLRGGQSYYLLPLVENGRMGAAAARKGVWRVKLVIDTKQLEEILSQEVNMEALIEQMRLAASSASDSAAPRRGKMISWGQWGGNWKPMVANLFKGNNGDHRSREGSPDFCIGSPRKGKFANELSLAT
ncbi:hypothetical protein C3L33_16234, partial [Rhododendron williamsianum]